MGQPAKEVQELLVRENVPKKQKNPRGGPHIHYNAKATAEFIIRPEAAEGQQPAHIHNDVLKFTNGQALMDCRKPPCKV